MFFCAVDEWFSHHPDKVALRGIWVQVPSAQQIKYNNVSRLPD